MVRIELMPWNDAREAASAIRHAVFVEEQGVPREMELDEHDAACVHALARDASGRAVGTGRLLPDGHIGRMAVMPAWRGKGVGGAILEELVEEARRRGHRAAVLSAQVHAIPFYESHGFAAEGETYLDADIPHRSMRRLLAGGPVK